MLCFGTSLIQLIPLNGLEVYQEILRKYYGFGSVPC